MDAKDLQFEGKSRAVQGPGTTGTKLAIVFRLCHTVKAELAQAHSSDESVVALQLKSFYGASTSTLVVGYPPVAVDIYRSVGTDLSSIPFISSLLTL